MRTYRVTIRGRFVELPEPARSRLRAEVGEHGVLSARYTADGTVTYGPELRGLVFRFESRLDDGVADPQGRAETEGRHALRTWAEGHGVAVTADRVDVTCLDDIKVHRPTARGSGRG
jgi:hypothetical protein